MSKREQTPYEVAPEDQESALYNGVSSLRYISNGLIIPRFSNTQQAEQFFKKYDPIRVMSTAVQVFGEVRHPLPQKAIYGKEVGPDNVLRDFIAILNTKLTEDYHEVPTSFQSYIHGGEPHRMMTPIFWPLNPEGNLDFSRCWRPLIDHHVQTRGVLDLNYYFTDPMRRVAGYMANAIEARYQVSSEESV